MSHQQQSKFQNLYRDFASHCIYDHDYVSEVCHSCIVSVIRFSWSFEEISLLRSKMVSHFPCNLNSVAVPGVSNYFETFIIIIMYLESKSRSWNCNSNLITGVAMITRVARALPLMVMKIMTIALLYIIGKYNSDIDVMEQTSTSLVKNHFSHSPRPGWDPRSSYYYTNHE